MFDDVCLNWFQRLEATDVYLNYKPRFRSLQESDDNELRCVKKKSRPLTRRAFYSDKKLVAQKKLKEWVLHDLGNIATIADNLISLWIGPTWITYGILAGFKYRRLENKWI